MHKFQLEKKPAEDNRPLRTYQLYDLEIGEVIYKGKAKDGGLMIMKYDKEHEKKGLPSTDELSDNADKYMWTVK